MKRYLCQGFILAGFTMAVVAGRFATPAHAAGGACTDDAQRLCQGVEPGQGRIAQCLKAHEAELSAGCKQEAVSRKAAMQNFQQSCRPDLQQFCADVQSGHGSKVKCLKDNLSRLSPPCAAVVSRMRGPRAGGPGGGAPPPPPSSGNQSEPGGEDDAGGPPPNAPPPPSAPPAH